MKLFLGRNFDNPLLWINFLVYSICLCQGRKNVLFLVVDDMRPQLGSYISKMYPLDKTTTTHTPNMDALASRSLLIERAYVQKALCGPSRSSFLTSRRPDTTRVYNCKTDFRKTGGNFTTIPQYFKQHGYKSVGMGKIFHSLKNPAADDPISWSEPYFHGVPNFEDILTSWEAIPDKVLRNKPLLDEQTADHAVEKLRKLAPEAKTGKQPFFMAVGFRRPHLPFVFPESYLRFHPFVTLPKNPYAPVNMPEIAWSKFSRIRSYRDTSIYKTSGGINATSFPDEKVIDLRRAYYSCVTWVDALIGRVLLELDKQELSGNTIISLVGDHGFHLGENGLWLKQTNFELATHAPMMISIQEATNKAIRTNQLIEFVDLFPTLVEAAGLKPLPMCPKDSSHVRECSEGVSFLPLIKEPEKPIKSAAFSQYQRQNKAFMGYSIRTDRHRYTEWIRFKETSKPIRKDWTNLIAVELYDHEIDPEENVNRARDRNYKSVREELSKRLHDGWSKAIVKKNSHSSETNTNPSVMKIDVKSTKTADVNVLNGESTTSADVNVVNGESTKTSNHLVVKVNDENSKINYSSEKSLNVKNKDNIINTFDNLRKVRKYDVYSIVFVTAVVFIVIFVLYKISKRLFCQIRKFSNLDRRTMI